MLARLSAILALMLLTAAVWWWWPVRPRVSWAMPSHVWRMVIAPNGQAVVVSHHKGLAYCDVASGAITPISDALLCNEPAIQVAEDGQTVVFPQVALTLWHPARGVTILDDAGDFCALAGQKVVSEVATGDQLAVHVHDFAGQRLLSHTYSGVRRLQTVPLPDGRVLALLYFAERKELQIVDLVSGAPLLQPTAFVPALTNDFDAKLAAVLSPDGQFLATLTAEGTTVYTVPTLAKVCTLPTASGEHFVLCEFNADGSVLATYRWTGPGEMLTVRLWRVRPDSPELLRVVGEKPIFSPNGQYYIGCIPFPNLYRFHSPMVKWVLGPVEAPDNELPKGNLVMRFAEFAPDSRTVAGPDSIPPSRLDRWLGQDDSRTGIRLLDLEAGRVLPWFREGTRFAYFPDGRSLAILNGDRLEVWDVEPRRPWVIEWGLPLAFGGLLLAAAGLMRRHCRSRNL